MKHLRPCRVCREPVALPADHCARCVQPDASALSRPPLLEPRWPLAALVLLVLIFGGALL